MYDRGLILYDPVKNSIPVQYLILTLREKYVVSVDNVGVNLDIITCDDTYTQDGAWKREN